MPQSFEDWLGINTTLNDIHLFITFSTNYMINVRKLILIHLLDKLHYISFIKYMNKRTFIQTSSMLGLAMLTNPLSVFSNHLIEFTLPALPYNFDALEPHFDKMTMEIHHGKHHQAYITNLNNGIKNTPFAEMTIEQILSKVKASDTVLRNNGGGHLNHSLFWTILSPKGGGMPTGKLAEAINASFGSFEKFKEDFTNAAKNRFGSGWAWLAVDKKSKLFISSTPNQDNPLMHSIVKEKGQPILGLDVWEHAYYLKYQNKRPDYINAFWNLVNWEEVAKRFDKTSK